MRKVLNSKEVKRLHQYLAEQYGYTQRIRAVFLLHEKKQKVSILSEEYRLQDVSSLRIDTAGLYIGAWVDEKFRFTIEGTQLIGPHATKNVIVITYPQMQQWLLGESLPLAEVPSAEGIEPGSFVIVRCGEDYLGCGKVSGETIFNYIPKTRYIHALYE